MTRAPAIGWASSRSESSLSAGGQLEQPSEVNSSTSTAVESAVGDERPPSLFAAPLVAEWRADSGTGATGPSDNRTRTARLIAGVLHNAFRLRSMLFLPSPLSIRARVSLILSLSPQQTIIPLTRTGRRSSPDGNGQNWTSGSQPRQASAIQRQLAPSTPTSLSKRLWRNAQ